MDGLESDVNFSETTPSTSGGSSILIWVSLLLAGLGLVLGAIGIFTAKASQKEIQLLKAQLEASPDKTPELIASLGEMDERLVKLGGEFVKLNRQDRQIRDDTQSAFNGVTSEMQENRKQINLLTDRFEELVTKMGTTPKRTASSPASTAGSGSSGAPVEVAEEGFHTVKSGETMSVIAKNYGVSLNELLAANPGVNPRALQIGQKLAIPSN